MRYRLQTLLAASLLATATAAAQDTLRTSLTYDLAAEAAAGTGDFTAFQLTANRYHTLATRPNTAYVRGALNLEHPFSADLRLSAAVDAIASVHADHRAYLQQCYANLSYDAFFIEAGSRELKPVQRDEQLSVGSFIRGNNAKPIPQVHFGTNDFWTVPLTKQWLQVNFDFGYGKFLDSGYREDGFYAARDVNPIYATGIYFHQKHLYLRTNPEKPIYFTGGIEHAVQFGGTGFSYVDGVLTAKEKRANLKAFTDVLLPKGNNNYVENDVLEDWMYGNHIGVMSVQLSWNIDRSHRLHVYLDDPFEDGSGMRKANGWDGLWGMAYENNQAGRQWIRRIVAEYFQSTNQCGPLHWNPTDHPEPISSQISYQAIGNDNYYNHMFYDSFSHYGMTPGIGLITSPIYNKDGYTAFRDNRIKAWNVGLTGEVGCGLSYLVKGSYQEGWGTYAIPLAEKHHSLDAMVQGTYSRGPWQMSAAYAFDKGNIYGDCSTFNLKISYHGKIL